MLKTYTLKLGTGNATSPLLCGNVCATCDGCVCDGLSRGLEERHEDLRKLGLRVGGLRRTQSTHWHSHQSRIFADVYISSVPVRMTSRWQESEMDGDPFELPVRHGETETRRQFQPEDQERFENAVGDRGRRGYETEIGWSGVGWDSETRESETHNDEGRRGAMMSRYIGGHVDDLASLSHPSMHPVRAGFVDLPSCVESTTVDPAHIVVQDQTGTCVWYLRDTLDDLIFDPDRLTFEYLRETDEIYNDVVRADERLMFVTLALEGHDILVLRKDVQDAVSGHDQLFKVYATRKTLSRTITLSSLSLLGRDAMRSSRHGGRPGTGQILRVSRMLPVDHIGRAL